MYRISKNKRKYSPTPIVLVVVDSNGHEQEEQVLCAVGMKKKEGDALSKEVVKLLNTNFNPQFVESYIEKKSNKF
jgi:hypothetical protein